jgi:hypothetical protein
MRHRGFDATTGARQKRVMRDSVFRKLNTCRRHGYVPDDLQPFCINFSLTICGAKQHFVKYQFAAAKSGLHSPTACVIVAVAISAAARARRHPADRALNAEMKTNQVMLFRQLQCAPIDFDRSTHA